MKIRLIHKGLLYLGLPFLIQCAFFAKAVELIQTTEASLERQVLHIGTVREMNFIVIQFCRTLAVCGKGDGQTFMSAQEYQSLMNPHLAKLAEYVKSTSADYQQVFNSSKGLVGAQYDLLKLLQSKETGSPADDVNRLLATQKMINSAEKAGPLIYKAWTQEEQLLDSERKREQSSRESLKLLLIASFALDFLMAIILITIFIKGITQRVELLVKNAEVLPTNKSLPNRIKGSDEIAFLDLAMHDASHELEKATGYRRSLMQMIGHDLKNPLMAMGLGLDALLKTLGQSPVETSKNKIAKMGATLTQVITLLEDLLALDKKEGAELPLDLTMLSTNTLAKETADLMQAQLTEKEIVLEQDLADLYVVCDQKRLLQVLANFIGNAVRYSPAGSMIRLCIKNDGKSGVVFSVEDSGPGVPDDLQEKVFEKYFQVQNKLASQKGLGYGLGLAICKQIIERHHGTIGVRNGSKAGAIFWFTLPAEDPEADI